MTSIEISEWNGLKMAYRHASVDEHVIKDTITDDVFFKGVPEYIPRRNDVIIDVGAHIGAFSVLAARRIPQGKVFAIEPSLDSYKLLKQNVEINQLDNIICFKKALFNKEGEIKLFYDIDHGNWGHSVVKEFSDQGEIVPCDTLENFFIENEIKECGFIKFNCEGAEFSILLSTPIAILKKIRVILVLYHSDLEENIELDELTSHLHKADFILVKRFQFGKRGWIVGHRNIWRHIYLVTKRKIKEIYKLLI